MFVLCPQCQFLVAIEPASGLPPARCPRCGHALRADDTTKDPAPPRTASSASEMMSEDVSAAATRPDAALPADATAVDVDIDVPAAATTTSSAEPVPPTPSDKDDTRVPRAPAAPAKTEALTKAGKPEKHRPPEKLAKPADHGKHEKPAKPADHRKQETPARPGKRTTEKPAKPAKAARPAKPAKPSPAAPEQAPRHDTTRAPASVAPSTRRTATPSFAQAQTAPATGARRWPLPATIAGLALLLVLQILLADRARLATDARWRPALLSLCGVLRCTLPPWHEPEAFALVARDVRPARPGVLRVSATFRNDARWPQPWPALHLALQDIDGRTVGARVFAPSEYLGSGQTQNGLASGQVASVAFDIDEPAGTVVAFTFDFR